MRVKIEVEGDRAFNAWTINLSQDGLCFEIPERVNVGDQVTVWIFLTRGKKIVGDLGPASAEGYIREVNTAVAAELGVMDGKIIDPSDATAVVVRL